MEGICYETTSLDPYAYIWDYPDNCVLSVLRTEEANVVKQGTKFYINSGPDSTTKFVFEVKNDSKKHCEKPTEICPTIYNSVYVAKTDGSFDLRSWRNLGEDRNDAKQLLQFIAPTENNGFDQLHAYDPKHTSHKTCDEDMPVNRDYEMQMGSKLD